MADVPLTAGGVEDAPLAYTVPGAQELLLKLATASFDGTAAAGPFLPCLKLISPAGKVQGRFPTSAQVVAGASADVSWFPRGGVSASDVDTAGWQFDTLNTGGWGYLLFRNGITGDPFPGGLDGQGAAFVDDSGGGISILSAGPFIDLTSWSIYDGAIYLSLLLGDHVTPRISFINPGNVAGSKLVIPLTKLGNMLQVTDHTGAPIFEVREDGSLHGKIGQTLTFDL